MKHYKLNFLSFILFHFAFGVNAQVRADFTADKRTGCGIIVVSFSDLSSGPVTEWSWDLGGFHSNAKNPVRPFVIAGLHQICLTVSDDQGNKDTKCVPGYIELKPSFVANLNADNPVICAGSEAGFSDLSVSPNGKIVSRIWDLGGSTNVVNTTSDAPVTSVYHSPGQYNITLYVKDESGCEATVTKESILTVTRKPDIIVDIGTGIVCSLPGTKEIIHRSANLPEINYEWDFGNGTKYNGYQPPAILYTQAGDYSIQVNAINLANNCSNSILIPNAVQVENIADFKTGSTEICKNAKIEFVSGTRFGAASHEWDFGDGNRSSAVNPSHQYASAGCYTVRHTVIYKGCIQSQALPACITVHDLPIASFTLDKVKACDFPVRINPTNLSSGINTYKWTANGNLVSTDYLPSLVFNSDGLFNINLEATNQFGCSSQANPQAINAYKIKPQISSPRFAGCGPLAFIPLEHNSLSQDPIQSVQWKVLVPSIQTFNLSSAVARISDIGRWDVRLIIKNSFGCTDSLDFDDWIQLGAISNTAAIIPPVVCFGSEITFRDTTVTASDTWAWDFGDGKNSNLRNPVHRYDSLGIYQVKHQSFHNGCPGTAIAKVLKIQGAVADFEILHDCDRPNHKSFKNLSAATDSAAWDFGEPLVFSDTSDLLNPFYDFTAKGQFNIRLISYNKEFKCSDTISLPVYITDLKSGFSINNKEFCAPLDIQVTSTANEAVRYRYLFPGSTIGMSDLANPVFRYERGGSFAGVQEVTDLNGCKDTFSLASNPIIVHEVQAGILASIPSFCQDSVALFNNISRTTNDSVIRYRWNWANQVSENIQSLSLRLDPVITSSINLHIESAHGCIDDTLYQIGVGNLRADFVSDTLVCNRDIIRFKSVSSGNFNRYFWEFGDSTIATIADPVHQYTKDGYYTACLTVYDDNTGCLHKVCKSNSIHIADPKASFTIDSTVSKCPPRIGNMINKSLNTVFYDWDFGDGSKHSTENSPSHLYTQPGNYNLKLIAGSSLKCLDTIQVMNGLQVTGPVISLAKIKSNTNCAPFVVNYAVQFKNTQFALFEYGDEKLDSLRNPLGVKTVSHVFREGGLFYPIVIAIDANSCSAYEIIDTVQVHTVKANFKLNDSILCGTYGDLELESTSLSTSPIRTTLFSIKGNGLDTSVNSIINHLSILNAGVYDISLKVHSEFCADSIEKDSAFLLAPKPKSAFSMSQSAFCAGDTVHFANQSMANGAVISSYAWKLGIQSDTAWNSRFVLKTGITPASLKIISDKGCVDSSIIQLTIEDAIFAKLIEDTTLCAGSLLKLSAQVLNPVSNANYTWKEANSILCTNCQEYSLRPSTSANFIFETRHPNGCVRSHVEQVHILNNTLPLINLGNDTTVCSKAIIPLSIKSELEVFAYQWDTMAKGLSCYQSCKNPIARPDSTTTYIVRVSNALNCERKDSITIFVVHPESIDLLGPDRTICTGAELPLNISGVLKPNWSGSDGLSCTDCLDPILRPLKNAKYNVSAFIQSCPVYDSIQIKVLPPSLIIGTRDTTICAGRPVLLQALDYPMIKWSPTENLISINSPSTLANPLIDTRYYVSATQDLCTLRDSINIRLVTKTNIITNDYTACPDEVIRLTLEGDANLFNWTGPNIIEGQHTNQIAILTDRDTFFTVIAKNETCLPDTAIIKLSIIPFVRLADSIQITALNGIPLQLNRNLRPGKIYDYNWSPPEGLSCQDCLDPVFSGDSSRNFLFQILDPATGCALDQRISINILETCHANDFFSIPNIFTPNADGINDELKIIPNAIDQIQSFRIFDRAGNLVFETTNMNQAWDGSLKGLEAPNGVYVFMIEARCPSINKNMIWSGDITLTR